MSKVSRSYQMGVESYRNEKGQFQSPDNDTPARVSANRVGQPLHEFYQNGELHRDDDKPAFIGTIGDNKPLLIAGWFRKGQAHREGDKPSAFEHNLHDDLLTVTYSKNGVLDRDPKIGPASFVIKLDRVNDPLIVSALFFKAGTQVHVEHPKLKIVFRNDVGFDSAPIDVQLEDVSFASFTKRIELPESKVAKEAIEEAIKLDREELLKKVEAVVVKEAPKAKVEKAKVEKAPKAPVEKKKKDAKPAVSKTAK